MSGRLAKAVRRALLVGVIALAAVGAGALWLTRSPWGQHWAAAQVAAALGPSVRFASVHFTFWPPPLAVALTGVEWRDPAGGATIRAEHMLGRIPLRALLGRPPFLAALRLEDVEIALSRAADGTFPLAGAGGAGRGP